MNGSRYNTTDANINYGRYKREIRTAVIIPGNLSANRVSSLMYIKIMPRARRHQPYLLLALGPVWGKVAQENSWNSKQNIVFYQRGLAVRGGAGMDWRFNERFFFSAGFSATKYHSEESDEYNTLVDFPPPRYCFAIGLGLAN